MSYDALAIANYFIERSGAINPMKAQKLVYFAHGWNLAINDQPLITDRIEAWQYGPVVPQLYQDLKEYGSRSIPTPVSALRVRGGRPVLVMPTIESGNTFEETKGLLERIWAVYGSYSAVKLSNATHLPGSPWDVTWKQCGGTKRAVINDNLIKEDFQKRLKKNPA